MTTNITTGDLPLVTLALFAYNQEAYIREAVQSAFMQDYPNLEIILSDDCSPDDTFVIMQQMVRSYRGPHATVLNRNQANLGIGGHINALNRLARGELIVAAAGDDVSLPGRVSTLVDVWLASNRQAAVLHSACQAITDAGDVIKNLKCPCLDALRSAEATARTNSFVIGATEAWDKALIKLFGDFRDDLVHEDRALPFRALLAGRSVMYVDQPLVSYRRGVGISSTYDGPSAHLDSEQRRVVLERLRNDARQKLDDLRIRPIKALEGIVLNAVERYDVALQFESGIPGPWEIARLMRKVGVVYVLRMVVKRIVNCLRDTR